MSEQVSRVAVIAYHSSPLREPGEGDSGGMTIYVRSLAEELARRGVHTDIFTRADGEMPRFGALGEGVRVIGIDAGPPEPLNKADILDHVDEFATGVRAFAQGQRIRYDLIHSHYWHSGLAAREIAPVWDVPFVHSHHTLAKVKDRFLAPGDLPEPRERLLGEAQVIARADVLIASTDDEWQQLACLYGASHDRLKTIHPGVDHQLFFPGDGHKARLQLGFGDEPILLYVGRIQPLKGVDLAIRALAEMNGSVGPRPRLILVGGPSGPGGHSELRRLRGLVDELDLHDRVEFAGTQHHDRLPTYYRAADVVVVCSHSESFGLTALEAHACGTPVVGTPVGGLSYIVRDGDSGYLLDRRDSSLMAAHLQKLLSDPATLADFGESAKMSARMFSWTRSASEMYELYDCLVDERSPEACVC